MLLIELGSLVLGQSDELGLPHGEAVLLGLGDDGSEALDAVGLDHGVRRLLLEDHPVSGRLISVACNYN